MIIRFGLGNAERERLGIKLPEQEIPFLDERQRVDPGIYADWLKERGLIP